MVWAEFNYWKNEMSLEIKGKYGAEVVVEEDDFIAIETSDGYYAYAEFGEFTHQQIAQLVQELSSLAWISVEDELPENQQKIQVKTDLGAAIFTYLPEHGFVSNGMVYDDVTHWQPLAKV